MATQTAPETSSRPPGVRRLIERAHLIVRDAEGDIFEDDAELTAMTPEQVDQLDEFRVLTAAHALVLREFLPIVYPPWPRPARCGWCVRAAGDTQEAANAVPLMDHEAITEHTLKCEHNPLVSKIKELEHDIAMIRGHLLPGSNDLVEEVRESRIELRNLRRRYAAALPAAARVSAHVRGARAALADDSENGLLNPEAEEQIRLWGDVADAFDAEHKPGAGYGYGES